MNAGFYVRSSQTNLISSLSDSPCLSLFGITFYGKTANIHHYHFINQIILTIFITMQFMTGIYGMFEILTLINKICKCITDILDR